MNFAAVVERLQHLENPYPGLRPFDVTESHLFFGRDQQVAELVRRLERNRFVAVLGVSGSGKSSLVRAGLIPALERGGVWEAGRRWRRVVTQPAGAPFESLAASLEEAGLDASGLRESSYGLIRVARQLADDETLLAVVDQFEELFRYKDLQPVAEERLRTRDRQAAEAGEFVQLLLEASRHHPPIYIVITMRSDYLGDCAEFRDLPETLNDCQYLVPRMTRQQRREAIEGPLGRVPIAPSLVQRMLNEAGDEPDQLPVLQHALMRTWSQWRKADPNQTRSIGLEDYEAIGGFGNALDQHAEQLLAGVSHEIAACVFKRLTARGRNNRERRDPATLDELDKVCGAVTPERKTAVRTVINQFRGGDATFLRPHVGALKPDGYIDITHESLIRLWKRLRDQWLPQEQLTAKTLIEVAEQARNWKAGKGELLAGLDFARVAAWDRERNKTAAWAQHYVDGTTYNDVVEFVQKSRGKEHRRALYRRLAWSAAGLVLVGGVGAAVYQQGAKKASEIQQRAEDETRRQAAVQQVTEQDLRRAQTDLQTELRVATTPVTAPGSDLKPRVYIQVRSQTEAARALALGGPLNQAGFTVPKPEVIDTGPSGTEIRYFRADERQGAEKIAQLVQKAGFGNVRVQYVSGFEDSKRIRQNHFELWLAPAELLPSIVAQLNDRSADVRKAAGAHLARDHRANPEAIRLVLDTLSEQNLPSLSAEGRINALYFLNRSDLSAWTDEHKRFARAAIDRIRARSAGGAAQLGPQTSEELRTLEQRVSSRQGAETAAQSSEYKRSD